MDNSNLYTDPKLVAKPQLEESQELVTAPQFLPDEIESPIFFPVSTLKLILMSIVTFGSYEIYWFYKNWKLLNQVI